MTTRSIVLLAAVGFMAAPVSATAQSLDEAMAHVRAGRYEEGIGVFRRLSRGSESSFGATKAYARALMEVGRYQEAVGVLEGEGERAASAELENVYGEALRALGRTDEAEAAFQRAVEGNAQDREVARLNQGILLWNRGERNSALALFDSFIDLYNGASDRLTSEELMAVGIAVSYLGVESPVLFQDAIMAFEGAADADPDDPTPELLIGELFLEKYKATEARVFMYHRLEGSPSKALSRFARPSSILPVLSWFIPRSPYPSQEVGSRVTARRAFSTAVSYILWFTACSATAVYTPA